MQTSVTDKALFELENYRSKVKTDLDPDLFQLMTNSIEISRFVAEVISEQVDQVVEQLSWHRENKAADFGAYFRSRCQLELIELHKGEVTLKQFYTIYRSETEIMRYLRLTRKQHSAAIAILELTDQISIEESSARMSVLAEVLIQTANRWSYAYQVETFGKPCSEGDGLDSNLIILAMGKLGGEELNFSSDIDLIFFYINDGVTNGGRRQVENSRFFQKVGVSLIKLLNEQTNNGFVFRVDMRLRPYGDSGNLVMSLAQAEDYYHEQGRGWERFAMVRARAITGSQSEKEQLDAILTPFAFRRYIDYGVIDSLRNMKSMIQREVRRRGLKGNIKLGAGGIREIEFMVQSMQLIQGGRDKALQQRNLLTVLPLLVNANMLPEDVAQDLASNYRFLRRLEHYLQELDEKQTQQIPEDNENKRVIAKLMGFSHWEDFYTKLEQVLLNTNQHFNELFGEERLKNERSDEFYLALWEGHIVAEKVSEKLPAIDLECSEKIIGVLDNFRDSQLLNSLSTKGLKRIKLFFPALLEICLRVEQPEKTLDSLLIIIKSILKRTAYLELLSENLPILQHLVDLVSRSDWVVKRLSDYPILIDELLYPNSLYAPLQSAELHNELAQNLLRIDDNDEEQLLDVIRVFKQTNELRVAAALLSEKLSISQASRYLTQIAEVIIQHSFNICWNSLTQRYGFPVSEQSNEARAFSLTSGFSIVAYGKLGGAELGFNSDLDLVFLFDQPMDRQTQIIESAEGVQHQKSISISRFYTRLAQKLIHFLSTRTRQGVLYEVDMRLRPSGNSGLLVSHIDAFNDYQKESAWTWEHQALVRARVVAGDLAVAKKFETIRKTVLSHKREQLKLAKDMVDMRLKMRQQLDRSTKQFVDLKQCSGGLVDIEFLAQYVVLNGGFKDQQIVTSNTVAILKQAKLTKLIAADDCDVLIKGYRKYSNYLNEAALTTDQSLVKVEPFAEPISQIKAIWQSVLGLIY